MARKAARLKSVKAGRRASSAADERLTALFLDMLAAERGAGEYACRLSARSCRFRRLSRRLRRVGRDGDDRRRARLSRRAGGSRHAAGDRGAAPVGDPPALSLSLCRRPRKDDPAAVLEGPKRARPLPKTLTLAEVDRLLRVAGHSDPEAPLPVRLRAARLACLVELLYATGLRVSELVALPASAARRDARVIVVRGKGNKERLVPLNDAAKRAMADYLALPAERGPARRRIEMAVPLVRRGRPPHPPAFRPRAEDARRRGRLARGAIKPARAAPRFRQPSPA